MRLLTTVALSALFSAPAFCADLVITKSKHADAVKMPGHEQPATDTAEVTWFGKDRMRNEDGDHVTIVRADQKKMYLLDVKAKTVSTIDLPLDMKKYMPPEMAPSSPLPPKTSRKVVPALMVFQTPPAAVAT